MPRKINPNFNMIKKQKKEITSRLMQISLKMDDYIYKDIPISEESAVMFIKEVSDYKDKCFDDKRSLQVIEKLTRCMKGIILEQQELRQYSRSAEDVTLVDVESILAFPVVDDLTQFTQDIDVTKTLSSQNNDIELIDLCDGATDINKKKHGNTADIIDLDNNKPISIHEDKTTIKNAKDNTNKNDPSYLQRAVSNLSIRDEEDPLSIEPFNTGDCSQSILHNFECSKIINDKITYTNNIACSQDLEEVIQPATITKAYSRPRQYTNTVQIPKTQGRSKYLNTYNMENNTFDLSDISINCKTNKIEKVKTKRVRKANQKYNNDNEQPKKQTTLKKNKQNKKEVVKKNFRNANSLVKNVKSPEKLCKVDVTSEQKVISYFNRRNDNSIQQASTVQTSLTPTFEIPVLNNLDLNIYNNEVANDLSWIENIRFVREIAQEEHIATFLEDDFWENYTLPIDWNNDDFLYT